MNSLGAKGAGEVGTIPAAAAIISAIEDALAPFGVRIDETPLSPPRLVALIRGGGPPPPQKPAGPGDDAPRRIA